MTIARALYREPRVLIFDEATSALDSEAERVVKSNKTAPWKHGNAFVIAHRLTTIRDAYLVCVLELVRGRTQCRCRPRSRVHTAGVAAADNAFGLLGIDLEIFDRLGLILGFDLLA